MPTPVGELFPEHRTIADDLAIGDLERELTAADLAGYEYVPKSVAERALVALARGKTKEPLPSGTSTLDVFKNEIESGESVHSIYREDAQAILAALQSAYSLANRVPQQRELVDELADVIEMLHETYEVFPKKTEE